MKGIRFYEEFANKRRGVSAGNVVAIYTEDAYMHQPTLWGLASVYAHPNSVVAGTGVGRDWLRGNCKRVSERQARIIHPALFERLDADDAE